MANRTGSTEYPFSGTLNRVYLDNGFDDVITAYLETVRVRRVTDKADDQDAKMLAFQEAKVAFVTAVKEMTEEQIADSGIE